MPFSPLDRINSTVTALVVLGNLMLLFALPHLLHITPAWGLLLVGAVWLTLVQWALLHESIHKILFTDPRLNEVAGRLLGILMGTSFHALRFGHLMHHQLNRKLHPEVCVRGSKDAFLYYANLTVGVYAYEIVSSWLLAFLPRHSFLDAARAYFLNGYEDVVCSGERFFYARGNIRRLRVDVVLSIALYAGAFYVYGHQWPWLMGVLGIRAVVLSFMDNIYHFATPRDNSKAGKELALNATLSRLMLHGNYHETHHLNPTVRWTDLPACHHEQQRGFDGGLFAHGLHQLQPRRSHIEGASA